MKRLVHASLAAAALLTPAFGLADEPAEPAGGDAAALFEKLDANKDGQIAADEVGEDQKRLFERLVRNADGNQDGQLNAEELAAGLRGTRPEREFASPEDAQQGGPAQILQQDPKQLFNRLDQDKDGKVTLQEVPEEGRERFQNLMTRADRDGDGALTQDELVKEFENIRRQLGIPGQQHGGGDPLFRTLDTDGDGKLSAAEISAAGETLKRLDRNGDGQIAREELAPPRGPGAGGQPGQGQALQAFVERLKQADADGDGKISKEEAPDRLKERFADIDKNGDGSIDKEEIQQLVQLMAARQGGGNGQGGQFLERLKQADKDGDGKLSKEEAPGPLQGRFEEFDANKDGFIDQQELRQRFQAGAGQNRPGADKPGQRPEGAKGKPGAGAGKFPQKLQQADKNGDGKLSKEEAPERLKERFDLIDANKDGLLEAQEFQNLRGKGQRPDGVKGKRPDGAKGKKGQQGKGKPGADGEKRRQKLMKADKNGDGKISKDEAPERLKERFGKLDKNNDGQLDAQELKQMGGKGKRPAEAGQKKRKKNKA
ncbi:MAG: EF-hand domain-containing protein [Pirellulales bacterium]